MRLSLALLVGLTAAPSALAHKLLVDAKVRNELVRVEAFYEDDTPAPEAKIKVLEGETVIAEGRTDDKGVWTFAKPKPGTYYIRAESLGHTAKDTLIILDPKAPPVMEIATGTPVEPETREQLTRTPWRRVGLGLGLIIGIGLMSLLMRKPKKNMNHETHERHEK